MRRRNRHNTANRDTTAGTINSASTSPTKAPTHFHDVPALFAVISDFLALEDLQNFMLTCQSGCSAIRDYGITYNHVYARNTERLKALYLVFLEILPIKRKEWGEADKRFINVINKDWQLKIRISVYFSFLSVANVDLILLNFVPPHLLSALSTPQAFVRYYVTHRKQSIGGLSGPDLDEFFSVLEKVGADKALKENANSRYAQNYCSSIYMLCFSTVLTLTAPLFYLLTLFYPDSGIDQRLMILVLIFSVVACIGGQRTAKNGAALPDVKPLWNKPVAATREHLVLSADTFFALCGRRDKEKTRPLLSEDESDNTPLTTDNDFSPRPTR